MKTRRQLAALEPMILARLHGLDGDDWHRAPPGRWSVAQTVHHLAIAMDGVVGHLEERQDRTDMRRRATPRQQLMRHVLLGVGRIPPGRQSVKVALPDARPDPELVMAQFRMAVNRLANLATTVPLDQQERIFVRHPVVGDLNLPEWVRFFYVHSRYHAQLLDVRLRWLRRGPRGSKSRRAKER
jgi:DinB superfamily